MSRGLLRIAAGPTSFRPGRASSGAGVVSALEEPCSPRGGPPEPEPLRQHRAGSAERTALCHQLTALCCCPDSLPLVVGAERSEAGDCRAQPMPFDHCRNAAYYHHAWPDTVQRAFTEATMAQRGWERTPVDERCAVFERAADLLAGPLRQRAVAAAVVGTAATAVRAELDVRQLVDQIRVDCHFMRDLTRGRCVFDGGTAARNANQYHGLEGFWAAISPSDSVAGAAQLALTPALAGNGVVWKPSDRAVLAAHRVLEALQMAGLPPGVVNFVPCERRAFLEAAVARGDLAGVAFGGTSSVLELVWRRVGENVERFRRFPRVVGSGGARNFHAVHASADLAAAAAGTARAAFEMAGQKATGCSRVFVARSVLTRFADALAGVARALVVCHPLDYRCFVSALASRDTFDEVATTLARVSAAGGARLACGGRADRSVGYYAQPTVLVVDDAQHWLLTEPLRGPLVVLHGFPDADLEYLEWAAAQAPFAMTGSVYAQVLLSSKFFCE